MRCGIDVLVRFLFPATWVVSAMVNRQQKKNMKENN